MAGIYRRFREAGYKTPKYLLPLADGRTVLGWVLDGLLERRPSGRVCFVANRRDEAHAPAIIAELAARAIPGEALRFIGDTAGQADTAVEACSLLDQLGSPADLPIAFHNVDTVVEGRDLSAVERLLLGGAAGWIDTFTSDSTAFSYAAADADGRVTAIVEKQVISPHATSGLYAFASRAAYRRCAAGTPTSGAERYISGVYQRMIDQGETILAGLGEPGHRTVVLGTPAEYEGFLAGQR